MPPIRWFQKPYSRTPNGTEGLTHFPVSGRDFFGSGKRTKRDSAGRTETQREAVPDLRRSHPEGTEVVFAGASTRAEGVARRAGSGAGSDRRWTGGVEPISGYLAPRPTMSDHKRNRTFKL